MFGARAIKRRRDKEAELKVEFKQVLQDQGEEWRGGGDGVRDMLRSEKRRRCVNFWKHDGRRERGLRNGKHYYRSKTNQGQNGKCYSMTELKGKIKGKLWTHLVLFP